MLDELIKRYPILERVREDIEAVYGILERCYENGGKLAGIADAAVIVPEMETYKIQELHLPVYHALCLMLEHRFYEQ